LRKQALISPRPPGGPLLRRSPLLLAGWILALALLLPVPQALAAEVLQVRQGGLLQVGDRNRSFTVRLACQSIDPEHQAGATAWLRRELPRHSRVNLHPLGEKDGQLLARVSRLDQDTDLSGALIAAGLAQAVPCPGEPAPEGPGA
jgi:endonuclease YncB( thermonuclease family)